MVKNLNVSFDDDDFARLTEVKEQRGVSWEELLLEEIANNDN